MKFFLDSALTDQIEYAMKMWDIDGVTTNPRHVQVSGKPFMTVVKEIADMVQGTHLAVSVEVNPHYDTWEEIVEEAEELFAINPENFAIKVPSTEAGFKACWELRQNDVDVNVTVCFSAMQALQAMRMGATFVSPFIGWKESNAEEVSQFVAEVAAIRDEFDFDTEIIVAAVRNARQIVEGALAGADIATAGFAVYQEGFDHPYTHMGLAKFQHFWDQTDYE